MLSPKTRSEYTPTIGIECHVQLKTKTKLFSAVNNDAREAAPNTLISHIDMGMPGALPVLNEKAVELACRAAFALHATPQKVNKFDRKHYFYPDLPKGYQITQFDQPIIIDGHVEIIVDGKPKRVRITRAHLEEDAGKSTHPSGKDYSLVDLNRAGTPLLEIVSEPDMHSAAEAKAYARELYLLMRYADVSDADLYYGNMRFDVNVSVSKTVTLGTRSETKNLNSFRSVEKAVEYEINRQIELLEKGQKIVQETRGWNDAKQKTFSQRSKEDAHDYRYMPEPDIPPLELDNVFIEEIKSNMPKLPADHREMLVQLGIDQQVAEDIVAQPNIALHLERLQESANPEDVKRVAFWMLQMVPPGYDDGIKVARVIVDDEKLIKLSQMVGAGELSSSAGKEVFIEMLKTNGGPEEIAKAKNLLQVSDESAIAEIVKQVLADNAKAAEDVKYGELKAIGFLVGQVMKASQGKANPALAQKLIKEQLKIN